ncbi:unnamed protein product [Acanthosepion pharaonis]|uniref:Uncharacterized protein n=1 Tax=Acanthosepion pharaonis TaxID=158019 RepID=A0A812C5E5_ACAPH|nr:unnamed protein product [Sepia pharaonis]
MPKESNQILRRKTVASQDFPLSRRPITIGAVASTARNTIRFTPEYGGDTLSRAYARSMSTIFSGAIRAVDSPTWSHHSQSGKSVKPHMKALSLRGSLLQASRQMTIEDLLKSRNVTDDCQRISTFAKYRQAIKDNRKDTRLRPALHGQPPSTPSLTGRVDLCLYFEPIFLQLEIRSKSRSKNADRTVHLTKERWKIDPLSDT